MFKRKPRWVLVDGILTIKGNITEQESKDLSEFLKQRVRRETDLNWQKNILLLDALKLYKCTCETNENCVCECVKNTIKLIEENNPWLTGT